MLIKDRIYGSFEVNEPVLLDLIKSKSVQRLKGIAQYGIPDEFYAFKNFTRYEHSIGVMLLVRKLGGSLKEQAAGLIHDVSHTAFSHVVDWLFGTGETEDYQDKIHHEIFTKSELPLILEKYGFEPQKISDYESFSLVDQPIPNLCADRVDYALREFQNWANPSIVKECVESMINKDNRIVFSSKSTAKKFGEAFLMCQMVHWGGPQATLRYTIFASALKAAIESKIIEEKDLLKDDEFVLNKLKNSKIAEIEKCLKILADKNLVIEENTDDPQYFLKKKFRYVDPMYVENGQTFKLSQTDKDFYDLIEEKRKINSNGLGLSIKQIL